MDHLLLLRIASKYQAPRVLRRLMTIFCHHLPSTLAKWDHWIGEVKYECSAVCRVRCESRISDTECVHALNMARQVGIHILMPAMFLFLATEVSTEELMNSTVFKKLIPANMTALITGQRKLYRITREEVFGPIYSSSRNISPECRTVSACHIARHKLARKVIEVDSFGTGRPFTVVNFKVPPASDLCTECGAVLRQWYIRGRIEAWNKLPAQFGLPSWDELRKQQDEFLNC